MQAGSGWSQAGSGWVQARSGWVQAQEKDWGEKNEMTCREIVYHLKIAKALGEDLICRLVQRGDIFENKNLN